MVCGRGLHFCGKSLQDNKMSDAQLDKVREEQKILQSELAALESSVPAEDAAKTMMTSLNGKMDPIQLPKDNEWVMQSDKDTCCTIC